LRAGIAGEMSTWTLDKVHLRYSKQVRNRILI
jgi:hypothetical protein